MVTRHGPTGQKVSKLFPGKTDLPLFFLPVPGTHIIRCNISEDIGKCLSGCNIFLQGRQSPLPTLPHSRPYHCVKIGGITMGSPGFCTAVGAFMKITGCLGTSVPVSSACSKIIVPNRIDAAKINRCEQLKGSDGLISRLK